MSTDRLRIGIGRQKPTTSNNNNDDDYSLDDTTGYISYPSTRTNKPNTAIATSQYQDVRSFYKQGRQEGGRREEHAGQS